MLKGSKQNMAIMLRLSDLNSGLRRHVRDQHIRVSKRTREYLGVERGEVLELEPCPDLQAGQVVLKVTELRYYTRL